VDTLPVIRAATPSYLFAQLALVASSKFPSGNIFRDLFVGCRVRRVPGKKMISD
jgi:hypothetical protein